MARIRTIKPEFWRNESLSAVPEPTHMLAAALLNYADDEGYFNANPKLVQAECSPLREPSVSIHDSLITLAKIGYIRVGKATDGKTVGFIVAFMEHQRINRPTSSKFKDVGIVWEDSLPTHTQLSESSLPERNREQGTGKGKEQGTIPTPDGDGTPLFGEPLPAPPKPEITPPAYSDQFEQFWRAYPPERRKEKPVAFAQWKKSRKATPFDVIMAGLAAYKHTDEVARGFAPYPAKWLKGERWAEDHTADRPRQGGDNPPPAPQGKGAITV